MRFATFLPHTSWLRAILTCGQPLAATPPAHIWLGSCVLHRTGCLQALALLHGSHDAAILDAVALCVQNHDLSGWHCTSNIQPHSCVSVCMCECVCVCMGVCLFVRSSNQFFFSFLHFYIYFSFFCWEVKMLNLCF